MSDLHLIPPDPSLFYTHRDPSDVRLGAVVHRAAGGTASSAAFSLADLSSASWAQEYAEALFVIVGCPQDEGVERNGGRPGAADAPREIRRAFYRLSQGQLQGLRLFDLGNTATDGSLEEIHDRHRAIVEQLLRDGKTVISLGGGNDLSYPDAAAAAGVLGKLLAFNLDAHLDVREEEPRNSGTPYRQLLEEGFLEPELFAEIGYQPFAAAGAHLAFLQEKGVAAFSMEEIGRRGLPEVLETHLGKEADAIFWGVDMDVVTSADAPGVSAPNPAGLSARELLRTSYRAGQDERSRLFEITEVNPRFDQDNRTSRLSAAAIHAFLQGRTAPTKEQNG